ncbi:diguanylate cyclase [Caballeronia arvi]|uniref:diguanylate cyclase n=1 Tax=Caballeronia arvi TaxID=1777135 RepID=A0A158L1D6_9BURK|nr:sensor domain-containing diguanylate cyclase [Caballeronia arvi]SAL86819.1 diguanylate cyclase [Caballeronia arvi]
MRPRPAVADIRADTNIPCLASTLLRAFAAGSAFVGIYDDHDHLRFANTAFREAFGVAIGQSVTFSDIILNAARGGNALRIGSDDPIAFIADAQTRRRGEVESPRQRAFPIDFVDDRWFWCTETLFPDGWIVLVGSDITSLKRTEKRLSLERDQALLLSGLDELTGVPNRRFTLARLDALLRAQSSGGPDVCIALVDLDHFKSINDTFGHETGDIALRHFSQHCIATLPNKTLVGRLGGEEFLIIFQGENCSTAKTALDELLLSIPPVSSRLPAHVCISITFSAGVARATSGENRDDLLSRADRSLYVAKRRGRSRVEIDEVVERDGSQAST